MSWTRIQVELPTREEERDDADRAHPTDQAGVDRRREQVRPAGQEGRSELEEREGEQQRDQRADPLVLGEQRERHHRDREDPQERDPDRHPAQEPAWGRRTRLVIGGCRHREREDLPKE
jgi:hypothetical protein